ncbi:sugar ABC transporter substrate-binding protein [Cohnella lubricantis]|uniref:Sugar ABC transporter substrate-binding protein n=2 Tax=Cohnella lubricantis TaxID=2163172 RepID=A0A841TC02_9BACL|nr:sugar ABC transporter substrate-binding protein [Cohnella lubricantis]MBB6676537.1 sugar ABC transporter substrate-binding protein [Cohnella lubricantis]
MAALTACGSDNNGGSASPANNSGSASTSASASAGASKEKVEISFMGHAEPNEKEIFTKLIKSFEEKYPNVKVNYTSVPPAEYDQKLTTLSAAGKMPDIFYTSGPAFYRYAEAGTILDIQQYLDQTDLFNPDNVWKQALDRYRYDGSQLGQGDLYGLPKDVGPWALAYNKELFDKAGVAYPPAEAGKWTWDDYLKAAQAITEDTNGDGKFDIYGAANFPLEGAVWANGGDYVDYATGTVKIDSPEFAEAMQWVADLTLKHHVAPSPEDVQAMNAYSRFIAGKIGMFPMGPWDQPAFWDLPFGWDLAAWPSSPKTGETSTWLGSMGFVISSKTNHPQEAFDLASFLSLDPDGQKQNMELGQAVPNLIDMATNDYMNNGKAPEHKEVFLDIVKEIGHPPVEYGSKNTEWLDTFNQDASKVWTGQMSAADWLKQEAPKLQELYDKGNK